MNSSNYTHQPNPDPCATSQQSEQETRKFYVERAGRVYLTALTRVDLSRPSTLLTREAADALKNLASKKGIRGLRVREARPPAQQDTLQRWLR